LQNQDLLRQSDFVPKKGDRLQKSVRAIRTK
jgi:hypothetical protein